MVFFCKEGYYLDWTESDIVLYFGGVEDEAMSQMCFVWRAALLALSLEKGQELLLQLARQPASGIASWHNETTLHRGC